jgi:hypothetical protein
MTKSPSYRETLKKFQNINDLIFGTVPDIQAANELAKDSTRTHSEQLS